jgi:hypothetical protein
VNYKTHYYLSWFRPLLRYNIPMSSGLVLKMDMCYKGVSRELEKFMWWKGENGPRTPCLKGRGAFYRPLRGPLIVVWLLYN